jgi:hypothetical protein
MPGGNGESGITTKCKLARRKDQSNDNMKSPRSKAAESTNVEQSRFLFTYPNAYPNDGDYANLSLFCRRYPTDKT